MALAGDRDGDEFCDDPFDDDEDDDDGDGEELYDDNSDAEEFCGDPCDDDDSEAEVLCGDPCDDEDEDDGGGEESCDDPCEDDEDEEFCDDDDDDDDDDDVEGEELCDDEEAGEGEGEDLCHEPSGEEGEVEREEFCSCPCDEGGSGGGGGGEGFCVSGFSNPDGSDLSESLEDRSASETEEEAPGLNVGGEGLVPPPAVGAFRMLVSADDTDIDSDSYSDDDDDSTYSDVGDVEPGTLPTSRAAVDGLPEASLSEEEALCGCAVCKDVFASGQRVVWLPCKHYFHGDCIRPWLAIRSTCPVCRYQLPTDDAESGQRQARQMMVLVPVAHQGAPPQSGSGGRGEGDGAEPP